MSLEWLVIRGSGVAAFALLTASTIIGILTSTKILGRRVKAKPLTWSHESLGLAAILSTGVHIFVLSIHEYIDFTWAEILVPGRSDWQPYSVALGIVAFYAMILVGTTFYVKRWIGQKAWRIIHFASFGTFIASLLHGMLAGTDTRTPLMAGLYLVSAIAVFGLTGYRMAAAGQERARTANRVPRPNAMTIPPLASVSQSGQAAREETP